MKVKATQRGFWPHNRERRPGDVFDYDGPTKKKGPDGKEVAYFPSWMEKLAQPRAEKAEAEKPVTATEVVAAEKAKQAKQ